MPQRVCARAFELGLERGELGGAYSPVFQDVNIFHERQWYAEGKSEGNVSNWRNLARNRASLPELPRRSLPPSSASERGAAWVVLPLRRRADRAEFQAPVPASPRFRPKGRYGRARRGKYTPGGDHNAFQCHIVTASLPPRMARMRSPMSMGELSHPAVFRSRSLCSVCVVLAERAPPLALACPLGRQ